MFIHGKHSVPTPIGRALKVRLVSARAFHGLAHQQYEILVWKSLLHVVVVELLTEFLTGSNQHPHSMFVQGAHWFDSSGFSAPRSECALPH